MYLPFLSRVLRMEREAPADAASGRSGDGAQGAADAVKDIVQDTRTQRDTKRTAGGFYRIAWGKPRGILKDLNRGESGGKANDLACQAFPSHVDHF